MSAPRRVEGREEVHRGAVAAGWKPSDRGRAATRRARELRRLALVQWSRSSEGVERVERGGAGARRRSARRRARRAPRGAPGASGLRVLGDREDRVGRLEAGEAGDLEAAVGLLLGSSASRRRWPRPSSTRDRPRPRHRRDANAANEKARRARRSTRPTRQKRSIGKSSASPGPRGPYVRPGGIASERLRSGAPVARRTVAGSLAHGVRPGPRRRAAHSCGSASVSHRLPPSGREPGTARNIRVARNRCRESTLVRRDDHHASSRGTAAPYRNHRTTARATVARGRLAGVGAGRHAACVQLASSPVYVALIIGIAWLAVSLHARPGPFARAFPVLLSLGVVFAVLRVRAHVRSRPTAASTSCSPRPSFTLPDFLGGFTVGGTDRAPDRAAVRQRGARHRRRDRRVRRVQRGGLALRARAGHAAARSTRSGWSSSWRSRSSRRRSARSTTSARPTAPAPADGSSGAAGCCASSCPCSSCGLERAVTLAESMDSRGLRRTVVRRPRDRVAGWCGVGVAARARRRRSWR